LAAWLDSHDGSAVDDTLVRLNGMPDGPTPLYGVVGLHLYSTIARALFRPVYGVFLPDEVAFAERNLRVETLASRYIEAIERRSGAPPKLLTGFSFGALVAFEMARQLDARGERPDLIVLLDPRLPSMLERRPFDPFLDLVAVARRDRKEAAAQLFGLVGRKLRRFRDRVSEDGETSDEQRADQRDRAYAEALDAYEPTIRPYAGRAVIYLARDENPGRLGEVEATWRRLVAPSSHIEIVPGTHGVLLTEPFVQRVNRPLVALLRRRPSVAFAPVDHDDDL
jgi:thioesterase domain-containing protein